MFNRPVVGFGYVQSDAGVAVPERCRTSRRTVPAVFMCLSSVSAIHGLPRADFFSCLFEGDNKCIPNFFYDISCQRNVG
jgi:hypothetical protein